MGNDLHADDKQDPLGKTARPHAHFEAPREVVADPELFKEDNPEALDSLEQDLRQLAVASWDGMSDGEATGLHEVLHAREVLEPPLISIACEVVLQDLHIRLTNQVDDPLKEAIQQALGSVPAIHLPGTDAE